MIRKLLATTALAGVIATSAFAQETAAPAADNAAPAASGPVAAPAPGDTAAAPAAAPTQAADVSTAPAPAGNYLARLETDQYLSTDLTGQTVYQSDAQDAEEAGEIENFLVSKDGKIVAAIIETDFLDEDKQVAVPFDKLTWATGADNQPRAVLTASREELTAAPVFTETTAQEAAEGGAMAPGTGTAATTTTTTVAGADTGAAGAAPSTETTVAAAPAPAPAAGDAAPMDSAAMAAPGGFAATVGSDQYLSETIVGQNVYAGPGADADTVGSINDLVITKNGEVAAAIVGVGGFLGMGEKNVGVPFSELAMSGGENGEPRTVLAATKEQLTAAPTFETRDVQTAASDVAADTQNTVADGAAATGAAAGAAAGTVAGGATAAATGAGDAVSDATTTASTGGETDRAAMTPVEGPELTSEGLVGTTVYGPNDQSIGTIGDIALTAEGQVDAIIVDVGGFLGIGQKPVAVAMDNLQFMKDSGGSMYLYTQFTQEQLEAAPEYNSDTYAENRASMRLEEGKAMPAATPEAPMEAAPAATGADTPAPAQQ